MINAGGIINASGEVGGAYRPERARELAERIHDTTERVIRIAREQDVPTNVAADRLVEERLERVRQMKTLYR